MLNGIDLARFDLNLLVVFEAVLQERHVGRAAARLHVTSSAVSHGLRRLREMFDDPLFLKAPKGVVPTARASALAEPVADILARTRGVVGALERFDPATSTRRFSLGAADATLAGLLPPLVAALQHEAPRIDLSTQHLLPQTGLGELDAGALDLIVSPLDQEQVPARFFERAVHEEEFVIAARADHPFIRAPSLRRYCEERHALVSITGDLSGYIDELLAERGLSRRVALAVPNFMLLLSILSETDLLAAIPSSLARVHTRRYGLRSVKAPLPIRRWQIRAIASQVALADPGVAWLFSAVERALSSLDAKAPPRSARPRRSRERRS